MKSLKGICAALTIAGLLLPISMTHAADIKERTLRFASQNSKDHPQGLGAQKFADLVKQKSGGKITIKLFPGGVLGGDLSNLSSLRGGTLDMMVMNAGLLQGVTKEFGMLDVPFLFNNEREADAVMDGPVGQKLLAKLPAVGLVGLGYWELGFRNVTNSKHPVTKLEDLQGLKLRVVQSPVYLDLINTLGANAVPLPFPEVYTALEQKAIDGQENPLTVIEDSKFNEVQKYLSLTRHTYNPQALLISKKTWDGLSGDEQKLIRVAAQEATTYQRRVSRERMAKSLDVLKKSGMQVNELAPKEIARLRDKVKPVADKYGNQADEALVQELRAQLAKLRGGK